ncbi:F510_1955 family glycosylhydrolase [Streptomyces sp. FIT100]|uniref:F510_1955 family glycosylhydrolase n=1 Tax=Streptomyces sp. FIT100 TaxID=2837956 RepID=UPI0021C6B402|nr:exo-alpha-sialidase [Streptomyces sp. FIT100]UUN29670.1 exo-alpha-sialidase [Streptomyces sp. FIT100]
MKNTIKRPLAAAAILALGLTLTACSDDSVAGNDTDTAATDSSATVHGHVHGLGIDPADSRLYVATHEGIFTPGKDSAAQQVGTSTDDFMGFTVAKAGTFLASGHPAPGTGGPANRGLIESTDSGKTWKTRSLAGEVDFHALDYAHGTIYGYDSTNALLRVSKDGTDWDDRARLQALDIAVSPDDPDTVLATTPDGIAKSTDGGKTFATGEQPTAMAFLSWGTTGALYGIDDDGALSRSSDGGATWQQAGTVPGGQAQALTALDDRHILTATQSGVYESTDGGKTFTKRFKVEAGDGH